ncbi:hypothetical protein C8R44DRAFT_864397 [Mycena epipterygia]|nr:hypothetical protein C8R44DRAFT_864397 [Mycena epipterygia]
MDSSEYLVGEDGKFPDNSEYIDDSEYMVYSLNLGAPTVGVLHTSPSQMAIFLPYLESLSLLGFTSDSFIPSQTYHRNYNLGMASEHRIVLTLPVMPFLSHSSSWN